MRNQPISVKLNSNAGNLVNLAKNDNNYESSCSVANYTCHLSQYLHGAVDYSVPVELVPESQLVRSTPFHSQPTDRSLHQFLSLNYSTDRRDRFYFSDNSDTGFTVSRWFSDWFAIAIFVLNFLPERVMYEQKHALGLC